MVEQLREDRPKTLHDVTEESKPRIRPSFGRNLKYMLLGLAVLLLIPAVYVGYAYAASPDTIRNPKLEHYHFRMQILVDGKAENFSEKKYQVGYNKDQCNSSLPEQPIHFHDNKDQFTHIHWEGMTGGQVLKYFGWNRIGGMDNALGYKLDDLKDIQKVTTHGNYLPGIPEDAKLYVYTGDEKGYQQKTIEEFTSQDLEKFFNKTSNSPAHRINQQESSLLDSLIPKAHANGGSHDDNTKAIGPAAEEELTRINNLIGNVVIFAQQDKPTDQQIKERFNKLEPLSDSTCGG